MSGIEGVKLTDYELQLMALFEKLTRVPAKDCIVDDESDRIIFVVGKGLAPFAVGKNGSKIQLLKRVFRKDVEIIEYGKSIEEAMRNSLYPAEVVDVKVKGEGDRKTVYVRVPENHMGMAIGRGGKNIKRAKLVARRYFGVSDVKLIPA